MVRLKCKYVFFVTIFFCALFSLFPFFHTFAQSLPTSEAGISLQASPRFPSPHDTVSVTLEAYAMNTLGASIAWFVDGAELTGQKNERSITFTAGAVGTKHTVRTVITFANGVKLEKSISIPVTNVDIVVEADTYTPSFYKGRALPSEESVIRAIAITQSKGTQKISDLSYEWKVDDNVLFGGPVRGKQSVTLTMPEYQDHLLSVIVYGADGVAIGEHSVALNPMQPEVYFYEESPLTGLSRKAISTDFVLVGEETSVFAEPYFMNTTLQGAVKGIEWKVDGSVVNSSSANINALNLRHTGGEGSSLIDFKFINDVQQLQYVQKGFSIYFK